MKDALAKEAGSRFPMKITLANGEVMVRYIRGFADHKSSILLISENSYSLALKVLEVKDIAKLEYAEDANSQWKILRAKWINKPARPLTFYLGLFSLFAHFHSLH